MRTFALGLILGVSVVVAVPAPQEMVRRKTSVVVACTAGAVKVVLTAPG